MLSPTYDDLLSGGRSRTFATAPASACAAARSQATARCALMQRASASSAGAGRRSTWEGMKALAETTQACSPGSAIRAIA